MPTHKHYKVDLIWEGKELNFDRPVLPLEKVETINQPRTSGEGQITLWGEDLQAPDYPSNYPKDWKNILIWGDNKLAMLALLKGDPDLGIPPMAGKINLIYIDPPFFTGADFSFKTQIGNDEITKEPSFIEEKAYRDMWKGGIATYLQYMYERLVLMRELLAENGSIYVHLDQSIGHYVKVILDEIFGFENFLGEVVWYRYNKIPDKTKKLFFKMHDTILHYAKTKGAHVFNSVLSPTGRTIKRKKMKKIDGKIATIEEYTIYEQEILLTRSVIDFIPDINIGDSQEKTGFDTQKSEELINLLITASSNPGDIVADFFCGSGTTLAVAEKLGRRWIGCDLSKYAIHITRKRLLDIHNSKDLTSDEQTKTKKYKKYARPFEIYNIGNYELEGFKKEPRAYIKFILKLYNAKEVSGYDYIHGIKEKRAVHIGAIDFPVSIDEVKKVLEECRKENFTAVDILGFEFAYEVNEMAKILGKKMNIEVKLIQIPSLNEIKSLLVGMNIDIKKIPDEIVDEKILKHIKFHELNYVELETKINGRIVEIEIKKFIPVPTPELSQIADKIQDSRELIDYWAIDWDYKGDTFHNTWQSFRTKKERKVVYVAKSSEAKPKPYYEEAGEYNIAVKIIDVFGNELTKILKVKID